MDPGYVLSNLRELYSTVTKKEGDGILTKDRFAKDTRVKRKKLSSKDLKGDRIAKEISEF